MSPRWYDGKDYLALDTGGGPLARLWSTALAGLVDIGYVQSTGSSVKINLPKTALKGPVELEWKIPQWSNTIERNRARTYFQAYAAACALHFAEKALVEIRAGRTKTWEKFEVPDEGIGCGFTEAVRGVLSHHMVIRDGKIANYHPYPPTPWNANPRDSYGTPGPVRGRGAGPADLRGERPRALQGHRHHADGPQLRPVPALRRAHVPRRRQEARAAALPDPVRRHRLTLMTAARPCTRRNPDQDVDWRAAGDRIDTLLDASSAGGAVARERAEELVRLVADLYGAGLERVLELMHERGHLDDETLDALADDDLVASLLLVHGLHPYDVTTRVERALEGVRPYLGSHGGDVELLEVTDDGCGPAAAAGQLRRLPVVVGHAQARGRGRDRGRRAGDHRIEVETPSDEPAGGG